MGKSESLGGHYAKFVQRFLDELKKRSLPQNLCVKKGAKSSKAKRFPRRRSVLYAGSRLTVSVGVLVVEDGKEYSTPSADCKRSIGASTPSADC